MHKLLLPCLLLCISLLFAALRAEEVTKPAFDIKPEWLHNDDLSDSTAAISWDINWSITKDDLPSSYFHARFHSEGTLALDEDANQSPLIAELEGFGSWLLGEERSNADASEGIIAVAGNHIPDMTKKRFHPLLLQAGLTARYETDQRLDHRNGVGSAFVEVSNNNFNTFWALIPTFRIALDGVAPDENETADALGADTEDHARFRALAHWNLGLGMLGRSTFLKRSVLSVTLEYTHDFGIDQKLEDAGQDESFGAALEYAYDISKQWNQSAAPEKGVTTVAPRKPPVFVFLRVEMGNFAPQPEDSTTVLAGLRFGMGDMVKLLSH